jgi:hypothetical protein
MKGCKTVASGHRREPQLWLNTQSVGQTVPVDQLFLIAELVDGALAAELHRFFLNPQEVAS